MDPESTPAAPAEKPPKKSKGGRPRKQIDRKIVEDMFARGATNIEVAAFFDMSHDTLERKKWFHAAKLRGFAKGSYLVKQKISSIAMNDSHKHQIKALEMDAKRRGILRERVEVVNLSPEDAVRMSAEELGVSPEEIAPELFQGS